jgi:hypothetical protein
MGIVGTMSNPARPGERQKSSVFGRPLRPRVAAAATCLALEIGSLFDYPFSLNHSEATMDNTPGGRIGESCAFK